MSRAVCWMLAALLAGGCASAPSRPDDLCAIFAERGRWHRAAQSAERRWRIPMPTMMAVMHKESSFKANARPPRRKILGIIPGRRPSTAFGFAQATDAAWQDYVRATGNRFADRDDFADAVDFVGWYLHRAHRQAGIARNDARNLYIAYYAGVGGYRRGAWRGNRWLIDAAGKVAARSSRYATQLRSCKLDRRRWWFG